MLSKLGILLVMLVLWGMAVLLFKESMMPGAFSRPKGSREEDKKKYKKERRETVLIGGPRLYLFTGKKQMREFSINRPNWLLGSWTKADCVLGDATISAKHCRIFRDMADGKLVYYLQNLSIHNPVEIYNPERQCYEFLRYKECVPLKEGRQKFYIGEHKAVIDMESMGHGPEPEMEDADGIMPEDRGHGAERGRTRIYEKHSTV